MQTTLNFTSLWIPNQKQSPYHCFNLVYIVSFRGCQVSINMLVCNPDKTDIVHFTSRFGQHAPISVNVNGSTILPKPEACDLGVVLDSHLRLDTHVNKVCKAASLGIRNIGRIRKYIECERLVHAFVSSKLDYCNSILYGLQDYQLKKLIQTENTEHCSWSCMQIKD